MLKTRGLIIADEQKAINSLKVISYFRLANYYPSHGVRQGG
jgi:abortive infection bacteriophage resistance protein